MGCSGSREEPSKTNAPAQAGEQEMGNKQSGDERAPSGTDNAAANGGPIVGAAKRQVIHNNPDDASNDEPPAEKVPKSLEERAAIVAALRDHFLFSDLPPAQISGIVDVMKPKKVDADTDIITQGEKGDTFYVLEKGAAAVLVDGKEVTTYAAGASFGELALMYSCERAATVRATEECKLWTMDLRTFRRLLASDAANQMVERCAFLKKVPLLSELSNEQLTKLADALTPQDYANGSYIIREGEHGDRFYIIENGAVRCTSRKSATDDTEIPLMTLKAGNYFGEMALLLDEPRNANCIAVGDDVKCLSLDRTMFLKLLGPITDTLTHNMRLRVLRSVPLLNKLTDPELDAVANALFVQSFEDGQYICRQGDSENTSRFYVINEGEAICTVSTDGGSIREVAKLGRGDFFGERALLKNEPRTANVIVKGYCDTLVLERDDFVKLLGPLETILERTVAGRDKSLEGISREDAAAVTAAAAVVAEPPKSRVGPPPKLEQLKILRTLGTGTFGRVKLVQDTNNGQPYALKCMMKAQIAQSHQQRNILNEKNILIACDSPFIMDLICTYNTKDELMMLSELLLGGELWTYIYDTRNNIPRTRLGGFQPALAQFYAGCVLLALKYLHGKNIAYRDLKPENLVMAADGYIKVIDFGFAKRIPFKKGSTLQNKSFTLCGTPDYLAPELVLSRGHDKSVDLWAFGVFLYELLCGRTPFASQSQSDIFKKIVRSERVLAFAPDFDDDAQDLIKRLLTPAPAFRIGNQSGGVQDILDHPWFKLANFDWAGLQNKTIRPTVKPGIKDPLDSSHFEKVPENVPVTPYRGPQNVFEDF